MPAQTLGRVVVVLLLIAASGWLAGLSGARGAMQELRRRAADSASLRNAHLQSELERSRTVPTILAGDPDLRRTLRDREPTATARLNLKLARLVADTRSTVIYVVAADGETIAASNFREPASFVGVNYSFRPYFREALRAGAGEHFALGTRSQRPGLFIARRVDGEADEPLGVVVVKVLFDALEARWHETGEEAVVAESSGIVLLTSRPDWRFRSLRPLPAAEVDRLRAEQRFGSNAQFLPLRLQPGPHGTTRVTGGTRLAGPYALSSVTTAVPDWTLYVLVPAGPALESARATGQIVGAALAALLAAGVLGLRARRRRALDAGRRQAETQRELEARVVARTGELSAANQRLREEMAVRRQTEARVQRMQDELVQATKLAVLGQVTAGVAHEINQPLAAVRSYADNAVLLLERGQHESVRGNLLQVGELTERIGRITRELRAFARKGSSQRGPVRLAEALDGTLLLLGARLRERQLRLEVSAFAPQLRVLADRARLEQVLVNLLQNAVDAALQSAAPAVRIEVEAEGSRVRVAVEDNGPGLSEEVRAVLFTPFVSTKPDGLGLGLVISRDIVAEFGGELRHVQPLAGGARFEVELERAP